MFQGYLVKKFNFELASHAFQIYFKFVSNSVQIYFIFTNFLIFFINLFQLKLPFTLFSLLQVHFWSKQIWKKMKRNLAVKNTCMCVSLEKCFMKDLPTAEQLWVWNFHFVLATPAWNWNEVYWQKAPLILRNDWERAILRSVVYRLWVAVFSCFYVWL